MSAPDDTNLIALLLLSKQSLFTRARESLLRGLPDDQLVELVAQMVSRDKPRGYLEEIARMMLDVLVRHDVQNDTPLSLTKNDNTAATTSNEDIQVKYTSEGTQTAATPGIDSDVSPETGTSHSPLSMRKRPASKRSPSIIEGIASTKRVKHEDMATENTAPSLRTWDREQTAGETVPVARVMYWDPHKQRCFKLALHDAQDPLSNAIINKFDNDYLSSKDGYNLLKHMSKHLKLYTATPRCINQVLNITGKPQRLSYVGDRLKACDMCIMQKRLCARFGEFERSIRLTLFPLPVVLRPARKIHELEFWVLP